MPTTVTTPPWVSSEMVGWTLSYRPALWWCAAIATLSAASLACSQADSQRVQPGPRAASASSQTGPPLFAGTSDYRAIPLTAVGRVAGFVEFDGAAPIDTAVHPATDAEVCGTMLMDVSIDHRGPRLANVVVWLTGVTAGKRLPFMRRYDLTSAGCRFVPRVQTAVAGGTLDVGNADQAAHQTRYLRGGSHALLATIPETESGAVVPSSVILASPGLVQALCDQHPWMRAWIAVFDHPYFTTTDANGSFAIDSVPPGRYRLSIWHERFGTLSDSVTVVGGEEADVTMKYSERR